MAKMTWCSISCSRCVRVVLSSLTSGRTGSAVVAFVNAARLNCFYSICIHPDLTGIVYFWKSFFIEDHIEALPPHAYFLPASMLMCWRSQRRARCSTPVRAETCLYIPCAHRCEYRRPLPAATASVNVARAATLANERNGKCTPSGISVRKIGWHLDSGAEIVCGESVAYIRITPQKLLYRCGYHVRTFKRLKNCGKSFCTFSRAGRR